MPRINNELEKYNEVNLCFSLYKLTTLFNIINIKLYYK